MKKALDTVTLSNDQIVPQSRACAVRRATTPLTGAAIAAWRASSATSWTLEYQINGQTYKVNYGTDSAGRYTYEFVDPAGNKRTEIYTRRGLVGSVSATSYDGTAMAAESVGAIFGAGLSSATRVDNNTPLPTSLNGASISVIDSLGIARLSPLFFVSPGQVNYQIPGGTAPGAASVSLNVNDVFTAFGELNIAAIAPGLFIADANGQGYLAAAYRYRNNALVSVEPVARFDAAQSKVVGVPIDLGPESDTLFLITFSTGVRYRRGLNNVTATIGGAAAEVLFAGVQGDFVGVGELNMRLPRSLAGRGDVELNLTVDGVAANTVKLNFATTTTTADNFSVSSGEATNGKNRRAIAFICISKQNNMHSVTFSLAASYFSHSWIMGVKSNSCHWRFHSSRYFMSEDDGSGEVLSMRTSDGITTASPIRIASPLSRFGKASVKGPSVSGKSRLT